jgi:predicted CXXCH cytochrome family protein
MMNDMFSKNRMHWPVMGRQGCLSCHNPHASAEKKLMKAPLIVVCGQCHGDTIARQERSETEHPPIKQGNCVACHVPHSSDNTFLFNQASVIELCGTCHDWQKHSTHPIGEKIIDPRNKNLTLQCLTCHRAHGTENKAFIYFAEVPAMCTQCHVQYKR